MSNYSKAVSAIKENRRKQKTYKSDYYSVNSIFGNDWAMFYALLGGRCTGKSYSVLDWTMQRKLKRKDKCKVFWMRLTDAQADKLAKGGGDNLIDPDIKRRYNLKLMSNGRKLYTYDEVTTTNKNGVTKTTKTNKKEFIEILACSTFYNEKGVASYDIEFEKNGGEYIFVLDEFVKENDEKSQGDILNQFVNALHNKVRMDHTRVKVILIGNTVSETGAILSAFNFIPTEFGRYKLKRKRCVIDYIMPNEKYLKQQEGAIHTYLLKDSSSFTNKQDENMLDPEMLVSKRKKRAPKYVVRFGKNKDTWFTLWNDNIIDRYNNENVPSIPMQRYLPAVFNPELRDMVFDLFDLRCFKFTNLSTYIALQTQLVKIRKK